MTGFPTRRARVHGAGLRRRHGALRTRVTPFAPYGFRAA